MVGNIGRFLHETGEIKVLTKTDNQLSAKITVSVTEHRQIDERAIGTPMVSILSFDIQFLQKAAGSGVRPLYGNPRCAIAVFFSQE